ncbi:uncharacterized protein LOC110251577 [Exaiptasia diaphana]|uniref:Folate receptor-like domain-containing protein n=1 Tax=Exaiptasia diaphana TaxID=2652724 RepID=A0A913Y3P0_EXADI|nr:uncharacterized protein LOC110251577 [Exaiptasia diaphana]KXJ19807.1 hypothetical protein AC249_AIPGENE12103 [Exaiptasia diaphana]
MAMGGVVLQLAALLQLLLVILCDGQVMLRYRQCTYFGAGRTPKEAYSLSNCTWYKEQSCCRHTEVTSVFSAMMPLETSSKKCHNLMNYLMCYFCSPEQEFWYRSDRLHICSSYCNDIYKECSDAKYRGETIGSKYKNGQEFCNAQLFKVVKSRFERCFEFDDTLFGAASFVCVERFMVAASVFLTFAMNFW